MVVVHKHRCSIPLWWSAVITILKYFLPDIYKIICTVVMEEKWIPGRRITHLYWFEHHSSTVTRSHWKPQNSAWPILHRTINLATSVMARMYSIMQKMLQRFTCGLAKHAEHCSRVRLSLSLNNRQHLGSIVLLQKVQISSKLASIAVDKSKYHDHKNEK